MWLQQYDMEYSDTGNIDVNKLDFHSRNLPTGGRKAMSTVISATAEVSKREAHGRQFPTELGVGRGQGLFPRKL